MADWWQEFFDADYLRIWEGFEPLGRTEAQVAELWQLLALQPGMRVLDAPCGYGRIARALAARGCQVLGVDQSAPLLAEAERRRGDLTTGLSYRRHDLRQPLGDQASAAGFDVALNIYTSLGYGTEADDRAILATLAAALRPGGRLLVETMHRDRAVAAQVRNPSPAQRLPDGTLLLEEPRFDPLSGRVTTTWYWQGPAGGGQKQASLRVYSATELIRLIESTGLRFLSAHDGCSTRPFDTAATAASARLGLLAVRP